MSPLLLIIALVFGMVAAAHYYRALDLVRPRIALQMRDQITLQHGLDYFVSARNMPQEARRQYVLSLAYSCIFLACIGAVVYREGTRVVAVVFAGIVVVGMALTIVRAMRLRAR
jgi:hypothetical protein